MAGIYADNPSQRTPCVLVLDCSNSMARRPGSDMSPIEALNDGLVAFHGSLQEDSLALSRVQIAAVSVGGTAEVLLDWTDARDFEPFQLVADGFTPLGEGIALALELIDEQKKALRNLGIQYTRPWILVITDGAPTDEADVWSDAVNAAREAEAAGKVTIFPIGVDGADFDILSQISERPPIRLNGIAFSDLFVWLSASLGQVTRSSPGQDISLPSTDKWGKVQL